MSEDRMLRIDDCLRIVPIGKSTFWKYVAQGKLPAPVRRLGKITMWRESDLLEWMAQREPQTPAGAA